MSALARKVLYWRAAHLRALGAVALMESGGFPECAERARADAWCACHNARLYAQRLIAGPSL